MAEKHYKPEEIVASLRQVDVLISQGQNVVDAIRQIGLSEMTYYRWRREFGGLNTEQVKRLKSLELENARLRKAVSELTLDKLILQEVRAQLLHLSEHHADTVPRDTKQLRLLDISRKRAPFRA
jgi:transposase-like protein